LRRPYKRHETHLPHKGKKQKLIISPRRRRHRPVPRRQEPFHSSRRRPNPTLNPNLKRTLNPPSSSRDEKETTMFLATRHQLQHFLRRRDFRRNKTLTCALVAEQSRTSPASSGSIAALDRMAEASKKGSKGRERRKKKEDDESVVAVQPLLAVQLSLSKTSLFLRLSSSLFLFLGHTRALNSLLKSHVFNKTLRAKGRKSEARQMDIVISNLDHLHRSSSFSPSSSSSFLLLLHTYPAVHHDLPQRGHRRRRPSPDPADPFQPSVPAQVDATQRSKRRRGSRTFVPAAPAAIAASSATSAAEKPDRTGQLLDPVASQAQLRQRPALSLGHPAQRQGQPADAAPPDALAEQVDAPQVC